MATVLSQMNASVMSGGLDQTAATVLHNRIVPEHAQLQLVVSVLIQKITFKEYAKFKTILQNLPNIKNQVH